jgi:hypothetical protein
MAGTGKNSEVAEVAQAEAQRRASREDLLTPQVVRKEVTIESLGLTVEIRSLSQRQRQEIRDACGFNSENWDESKAMLMQIVACVEDPKLTMEDLDALVEQSADIVDELNLEISMLNMMGRAGELKKDSSETQS